MSDELAPLQHHCKYADGRVRYGNPCAPRRIPMAIAEAAFAEWYAVQFPSSARRQPLARLNERGGFSCGELDMWNPKWRDLL